MTHAHSAVCEADAELFLRHNTDARIQDLFLSFFFGVRKRGRYAVWLCFVVFIGLLKLKVTAGHLSN